MSGAAIMQDGSKHIYHSIAMEPPGAVTVPDGPRCCAGGRKVMTLLLASALLWVIVLDIMLVVYRSHHLGGSGTKTVSDSPLAGRLVIFSADVAPPGNSSFSTPPPMALPSTNVSSAAAEHGQSFSPRSLGETFGNSDNGHMPAKIERSAVAPLPGLESWLARLRHRSEPMTSLDRPHWRRPSGFPTVWTPIEHFEKADHRHAPAPFPFPAPAPAPAPGSAAAANTARTAPPQAPDSASAASGAGSGLRPPPPQPQQPPPPPPQQPQQPQPPAASLLMKLFRAVVDAPWNMTSAGDEHRPLHPLPPPPPPRPFLPPPRFIGPFPRPNFSPIIHFTSDEDDAEEAIFDIDITD